MTEHLTIRGAGVVPSCCDDFVLDFGFLGLIKCFMHLARNEAGVIFVITISSKPLALYCDCGMVLRQSYP